MALTERQAIFWPRTSALGLKAVGNQPSCWQARATRRSESPASAHTPLTAKVCPTQKAHLAPKSGVPGPQCVVKRGKRTFGVCSSTVGIAAQRLLGQNLGLR